MRSERTITIPRTPENVARMLEHFPATLKEYEGRARLTIHTTEDARKRLAEIGVTWY